MIIADRVLVFNIQRYSVHDGPGIRTIVFLKGCPLSCPWCSNPEGQSFDKELWHNSNLCRLCGKCAEVCPARAVRADGDGFRIDREKCVFCGKCVSACPADALKLFGDLMSADQILSEVEKDFIFYRRSGGGLTVSGGEPLAHPDFLYELFKKAKEEYSISTAIETTCYAPHAVLERMLEVTDYFLADIKLYDSARHKAVVGVPNEQILENIRTLSKRKGGKSLLLRMPVIPGINDDEENLRGIAGFIRSLGCGIPLELLPYHEFGKAKYSGLGLLYQLDGKDISSPEKDRMASLEQFLMDEGVQITHT